MFVVAAAVDLCKFWVVTATRHPDLRSRTILENIIKSPCPGDECGRIRFGGQRCKVGDSAFDLCVFLVSQIISEETIGLPHGMRANWCSSTMPKRTPVSASISFCKFSAKAL